MKESQVEDLIYKKIEQVKKKGLLFFAVLNKNVKIKSYSYFNKENKIQINVAYGYGLNEETFPFIINENELDSWLLNFATKKEVITSYDKDRKPENNNYKYSKKMSDKTDNNISILRGHLFNAIQKLEAGTMKSDEAKAMASLAQTIINSAKLELDYKRMIEKQPDIKMLND